MGAPKQKIFHLSDVHFGVQNADAIAWFTQAAQKERPDAILCTGDLTQRAKHSEFAQAQQFFARFDAPIALEPGNHDMPYYNLWERFTQPYKRYGALAQAVSSGLELDQILVVPLKTTTRIQPRFPWSDGYVHRKALAQAVQRLEAVRDDPRFKLVTCHHPLLPAQIGDKNPTIGGDTAFAALAEAGAQAVLSGHVHAPFDLSRSAGNREIRMIGAGTLSTRLRGAPPGYNVLHYSKEEGLQVEPRVFTGKWKA